MKVSNKRRQMVYGAVHEEIMQARIKVQGDSRTLFRKEDVEKILQDLNFKAPHEAVEALTR